MKRKLFNSVVQIKKVNSSIFYVTFNFILQFLRCCISLQHDSDKRPRRQRWLMSKNHGAMNNAKLILGC